MEGLRRIVRVPQRESPASIAPRAMLANGGPAAPPTEAATASPGLPKFQYREERLLRHLDPAHLLHPLLALLLGLEQLALA